MPRIGIIPFILQEVNGYYEAKRAKKQEEMDRIAKQLGFALKTMQIQKEEAQRILAETRAEVEKEMLGIEREKVGLMRGERESQAKHRQAEERRWEEEAGIKRTEAEAKRRAEEGKAKESEALRRIMAERAGMSPESVTTGQAEAYGKEIITKGAKLQAEQEDLMRRYGALHGELQDTIAFRDDLKGRLGTKGLSKEEKRRLKELRKEAEGRQRGVEDSIKFLEQELTKKGIPRGPSLDSLRKKLSLPRMPQMAGGE